MRLLLLFLLFSLSLKPAIAQTKLNTATEKLIQNKALAFGSLGIAVVDVRTGEILKAVNANRSFVPASLMKVPTTAMALDVLGSDFRFETQLCYTGTIREGTLDGDLIIVGGGDPSLGAGRPANALSLDELFARWTEAVSKAGIVRITGNVIGEESIAPGAEPSPYWQWNDIGNYYGAGAGGLMINENMYELKLKQTPLPGQQPTIVELSPDPGALRWTNELISGPTNSGDESYIFGAPGTLDRVIRGSIPAGKGTFTVKGSLPNPALHTAQWLTEALKNKGISVNGVAKAESIPEIAVSATQLDSYLSPPLVELAKLTNFRSVNLYAEAFYEALGRTWGTSPDPALIGERMVEEWEKKGVAADGFEQVDGSGLGMRNLITPLELATILRLSSTAEFEETLPMVSKEGTVGGLLRGKIKASNIRAKSGTLMRSRGFCGYALAADGRKLAFVIIANNYSIRHKTLRNDLAEWMLALVE